MHKKLVLLGMVFLLCISFVSAQDYDYWRQDDDTDEVWFSVNISASTTKEYLIYNTTGYFEDASKVFPSVETCDQNSTSDDFRTFAGSDYSFITYDNMSCENFGSEPFYSKTKYDITAYSIYARFFSARQVKKFGWESVGISEDGTAAANSYIYLRYLGGAFPANSSQYRKYLGSTTTVDIVWENTTNHTYKFYGTSNNYYIDRDGSSYSSTSDPNSIPDVDLRARGEWDLCSSIPGDCNYTMDYIYVTKNGDTPSESKSCNATHCFLNLTSTSSLTDYQALLSTFSLNNDLTITDTFVRLSMQDSYTGNSIDNFSVDYNGDIYYTGDGEILIDCDSNFIDVTFFNASNDIYFNSTSNNIDCINTHAYTGSSVQSNITFLFVNSETGENITGRTINVNDLTSGVSDSTTTEIIFMNPVEGSNNFEFTSNSFASETLTFSVTGKDISTIQINLTPTFNITFYDETTLAPFDFSNYNSSVFEVFCTNNVSQYNITTSNNAFNLSCDFFKIKMTLTLGSDIYYRSLLNIDLDFNNVSMYLIDIDNTTAILNTFILYDIFNDFDNKSLTINKITDQGLIQIHSDFADIRDAVSAYLIQFDEYVFTVGSSNKPDRFFGTYVADAAGDFTIRLFDLDFAASNIYTQTGVQYTTYNDDGIIRSFYNDTTFQTVVDSATFTVRLNNESGTLLYLSSSTDTTSSFAYAIPSIYNNETLYTQLFIDVSEATDITHIVYINNNNIISTPSTFDHPDTLKWIGFFVLVALGLTATISTQSIVGILLIALGGLLNYIGWVLIGYPVLSVGALISLINLFMGDKK